MIEHYSFGSLKYAGKVFRDDVTIVDGRVHGPWWREQGHLLRMPDLSRLRDSRPEVLVVGTGSSGLMKVGPDVEGWARERGVELEIHPTGRAVEIFNDLESRGKDVAGAFHLGC